MRQVTGSNSTATDKKVSIQLRLDGHSFSRELLPAEVADNAVIEVELLTSKTVMVPEECFAPELAAKLLWLSGVVCDADEQPVWSNATDGVIVVMALNREVAEVLTECYGSRVEYTSPMLRGCTGEGRYLCIYIAGSVAYIKLYNAAQLDFCEALAVTGADDVLYAVERIAEHFDCEKLKVKVAGEDADSVITMLKQYYKVLKCE